MWYSNEVRRDLFKALRRSFPDKPLPYTYPQMREIGKSVGIEHSLGLWWLRMDLRELAYDTWRSLTREGDIQKATRRDLIENDIIKPSEQLANALTEARRIGATEAFWLTQTPDVSVDLSRLQSDLRRLRKWALAAKEKAMDGSVPKGMTVVRQDFVIRLFSLFDIITGDEPTRNVIGADANHGNTFYEVSKFSRFVELCAEPIFDQSYDFSTQIRYAQDFHRKSLLATGWAGQPPPNLDERMEKIRRKIGRKNP